jgi:hypothetical protein
MNRLAAMLRPTNTSLRWHVRSFSPNVSLENGHSRSSLVRAALTHELEGHAV